MRDLKDQMGTYNLLLSSSYQQLFYRPSQDVTLEWLLGQA